MICFNFWLSYSTIECSRYKLIDFLLPFRGGWGSSTGRVWSSWRGRFPWRSVCPFYSCSSLSHWGTAAAHRAQQTAGSGEETCQAETVRCVESFNHHHLSVVVFLWRVMIRMKVLSFVSSPGSTVMHIDSAASIYFFITIWYTLLPPESSQNSIQDADEPSTSISGQYLSQESQATLEQSTSAQTPLKQKSAAPHNSPLYDNECASPLPNGIVDDDDDSNWTNPPLLYQED